MTYPRIAFAERCSWRAIYLRTSSGWQYFHAGLSPSSGPERVEFFCGLSIRTSNRRRPFGFYWRFPLMWAQWSRSPDFWWRFVSAITHRLDGRYR